MLHKIGMPELLIILAIALVIFGAKTLPKMGAAMGKTIGNFKRGVKEMDDDESEIIDETTVRSDSQKEEPEKKTKTRSRSGLKTRVSKPKAKTVSKAKDVG